MNPKNWIGIGALFGFLSVALGAFGAHSLKESLSEKSAAIYQTAAQYQMSHALALVLFGLWASQNPDAARPWVGWAFTAGILLFSGSLYALAMTGIRGFGAITPLGGVSFLVGWIMFAFLAWRA